jgi:hypothetical protein
LCRCWRSARSFWSCAPPFGWLTESFSDGRGAIMLVERRFVPVWYSVAEGVLWRWEATVACRALN